MMGCDLIEGISFVRRPQRQAFGDLLVWLLVLVASTSSFAAAQEVDRPNILLIVADDLGFSDLGCFGGEIQTPNLDQLAQRGLRLTQFYTTGRCCPSRASLLSGQYPHAVGLGHMTKDIGRPGYRGRIASDAQTIVDRLGAMGYRSFLSGKWHLGTDDPTQHGFEEFYGTLVSAKTFWDWDHFLRLPKKREGETGRAGDGEISLSPTLPFSPAPFYGTDALGDHALEFLSLARETPKKPWFLYLAFNAPHFPLHAPPETIAKYADRYHDGWDVLRHQRLAKMKSLGIIPPETTLTPRSKYYDWGEFSGVENPSWDSLAEDRRADLARRMAIYAAMVDRMDQNVGRVLDELRNAANSTILWSCLRRTTARAPNGMPLVSTSSPASTIFCIVAKTSKTWVRKAHSIVSDRAGPTARTHRGVCTSILITKVVSLFRALSTGPAMSPNLVRLIQLRHI